MHEPPYPTGPGSPGPPPPGPGYPTPWPGNQSPQPAPRPVVAPDALISPDYSGWWRRGLMIVKAGWRQLLLLQLIVAIVTFALRASTSVALRARPATTADPFDPFGGPNLGGLLTITGVVTVGPLIAAFVSTLTTLASLRLSLAIAAGHPPRIGDALRFAARRAFPLIGWGLLAGLIILAGVCACVLPAFYLAAVFVTLPAVVAFERGNAIGRCFQLFHRSFGAATARTATILVITIAGAVVGWAIAVSINSALTPAGATGTRTAGTASLLALSLIGLAVSTVLSAGLRVLVDPLILTTYADLRARVEPFSTAALVYATSPAQALDTNPPQGWR
jgi:hypothetical protein